MHQAHVRAPCLAAQHEFVSTNALVGSVDVNPQSRIVTALDEVYISMHAQTHQHACLSAVK